MTCPRCRADNREGLRFCEDCGARLVATCPACGAEITPGKRFCGSCGAPRDPAAAQGRFATPRGYTPAPLADKILGSRSALEGERKQVTILFADVKGSMDLLADRDPEDARRILDPLLELMMGAVHRYEGTVNQVMGDGIMALFGAPIALEDHAVRACYAALHMQGAVRHYGDDTRRAEGVEVQVRIGLNSGEVVVRSIGSDLRMDYTAVGQTTHLAARMEQMATPGTIRITGATLHLSEGFVKVKPLGPVPVKGLAEAVEVFELTSAASVRTRLHAARGRGLTRFVGRDTEMEQLRQAAAQARGGRGQVVAVVGDPGVGKSRLFYEFIHSHRTADWLVLEASSVSYGTATPFLPVTDLLRGYFRIDGRDDIRSVRAKATGTLLTLDRALEEALPAVTWLLDALDPEDPFLALEPALRRQRALDAVKRVLLRESQLQPLMVVFEDLHWIDAETQGALDGLVESLPTVPILLAVNYRPEYRHGWGGKTYYRQLRIDPLAPEGADALLRTLLGADATLESLTPLLIQRTDGNPFFLEECVRTLVETGALGGEPGAYRLERTVDAVQVPATVQAILSARIDRLPPDVKRLLQAASVIGKDVPAALLEAVAETDADALGRALGELQAAEFLYEVRLFPDREYTFKHALTHEVAYGSLLQDRRSALHAGIVEAIERLHADRLAEQVEVLAQHALRGGVAAKAVRYLRQAGARAVARSANREAVGFLEQALTVLGSLPDTPEHRGAILDTLIALGPALIAVNGAGAPVVEATYRRALGLAEGAGDGSRLFPGLWGLWYVNYTHGRYAAALATGGRLLEAAQRDGDPGRRLEAHHALWSTLSAAGRPADAVTHMEQGRELYERDRHAVQTFLYGGHDPGACCRYHLAMNRWLLGYPDASLRALDEALGLVATLEHPLTTVIGLWFASWVRYQRRDWAAMVTTAERVRALATEHGLAGWINSALVLPRRGAGEPATAPELAELHERLRVASAGGARWRHVFCLSVLAEMYAEAGLAEEGLGVLAAIGEDDRSAFCGPDLHRIEGDLRLRGARPAADRAEQCYRLAIDLARRRAERAFELRAALGLARLWRERGRRDDARGLLTGIYGWFTEGHDTADLRAARALLDELA